MWKSDLGCNSKWAFGGLTEVSCWVEAKTRRTTTTHQQSASACLQGNNNQSLRLLRNPTRKRWTIWQHGCTYIGRLMSISPLCKVISASTTLSKQQTPQHLRWKTSKWPLTSEKCTLHSVHSVQCTHMFVHKFDHLWDKKLAIPSTTASGREACRTTGPGPLCPFWPLRPFWQFWPLGQQSCTGADRGSADLSIP